jgi:tetratricopeptide (TPR) repeat protein
VEETRLLREAAARESQGDLEGAERVLRRLLEASPASSGGLFALERVLRTRGEPRAILPAVDTFLAHDPSASGVRYLKLRVLSDLDSLDAVRAEGERWLVDQPDSEAAYREVARIYERAFGADRALDVLRRGRSALRREDAYALEIGDQLAASGDMDGAVSEWARAAVGKGVDVRSITRRITGLPGGNRQAGTSLIASVAGSGDSERVRTAASIALDLRIEDQALALSRRVANGLRGRGRDAFLSDVARRARDAGLGEVAAWAYGELGQDAGSPAERRQFDQRLVDISLATGDSATALEAQRRVVASFTPGSVDRRQATARVIELESGSAPPDRLTALLSAFRAEFPTAPEMDQLTATVAGALLARGDDEGAYEVLEGIEGPRSALQRGYLLLAAGQVAEGRKALLLALPGMPPAQATEVIQFAGLLGRLSPRAAELVAEAGVRAHEGKGSEAADLLSAALDVVPEEERATLLAEAARLADRGETAAALRTRLLEAYPDAPEAAEASLALARYHAGRPAGRAEAIRLLEELVTRTPNAAVAPAARRELERLKVGA